MGVPKSDVAAVLNIRETEVTIPALDGLKIIAKKISCPVNREPWPGFTTLRWKQPTLKAIFFRGCSPGWSLSKKTFEQAVTVPLYSMLTEGSERYVFVETDGKGEKRPVSTGLIPGGRFI